MRTFLLCAAAMAFAGCSTPKDGEGTASTDGAAADSTAASVAPSSEPAAETIPACECTRGTAGETVWCPQCHIGYVKAEKVHCPNCYESFAAGGDRCTTCASR